jgi:hypothetical protein
MKVVMGLRREKMQFAAAFKHGFLTVLLCHIGSNDFPQSFAPYPKDHPRMEPVGAEETTPNTKRKWLNQTEA